MTTKGMYGYLTLLLLQALIENFHVQQSQETETPALP